MRQMTSIDRFFMTFVVIFTVISIFSVECGTLDRSSGVSKNRKLDNFVEFTHEGDQLAVESMGSLASVEGTGNKREILGKDTSASTTGRQCPNVHKAVYPVIPVIIASLVGLIGAIIISAIVRLVFRIKNDKDTDSEGYSEYGASGYDRRVGKRNMFGFDLGNINFARLAKNVLIAIDKIY